MMASIYWTTTGIIVAYLLFSSGSYLFSSATIEGVRDLGFPDHFRVLLAVLKLIAAITLILPAIPMVFKEWAYAGIGLFIITAFVAHYAHEDPIWLNMVNVVLFMILALSRWSIN